MKKIIFSFFLLFFLLFTSIYAQDGIPDAPIPPKLVNNFSKELPNFLSNSEEQQLEQKLETFSNTTSNQIVIVIVDDLGGLEPYEYASKLGNKWGVGQQKLKNGVVILVKPTGEAGDRIIFISPSGGLQGAIPDVTANRIIQKEIIPEFKNGNFYQGLDKGTTILMALAKGEYSYEDYNKSAKKGLPTGMIILLIILFIIISLSKRRRRGYGIGGRGVFWGAAASALGRGWSGGGSSGGFGGFGGGGGFNGGGSSGRW